MSLSGKTLFISGASRGIGLAIALRAARDGANVARIAKTAEPHPKLEGPVYTAAAAIEEAGDLHGERRAAGNDAAVGEQLCGGAQHRLRVDAAVRAEPLVLGAAARQTSTRWGSGPPLGYLPGWWPGRMSAAFTNIGSGCSCLPGAAA